MNSPSILYAGKGELIPSIAPLPNPMYGTNTKAGITWQISAQFLL